MPALRQPAVALVVALLVTATLGLEGKKADPWEVPEPDYTSFALSLVASPRSYDMHLGRKVPDAAVVPERVEPPATEEERKSIQACRDLQAAGKWPESEAALRGVLAKGPALHDARTLLGIALLRQKKPADAAVALRDSIIGNRRSPDAWKALEETAAALGRKVARPTLQPRGWVLALEKGAVQVGYADSDKDADFGWNYYASARAYYRYEGPYEREYARASYRFTFREQLFAAAAAALWAEDERKEGKKVAEDLARLAAEKKGRTLVPFVYFAMYPEPLPAVMDPERDFALLRPRLEKYFDERILVRK